MVLRIVLTSIVTKVLIITNKIILRPESINRYESIILENIFAIIMIELDSNTKRRMK